MTKPATLELYHLVPLLAAAMLHPVRPGPPNPLASPESKPRSLAAPDPRPGPPRRLSEEPPVARAALEPRPGPPRRLSEQTEAASRGCAPQAAASKLAG